MSRGETRTEGFERVLEALAMAPDALAAPTMLRHFRVLSRLGAGGMGTVLKAEDTRLGRIVAIKRLNAEARQVETVRQRLLREARIASALVHPNIVTIFAIEELDGEAFIVMEYVEGEPLDAVIRRGPLPLARVLAVGQDVAGALACAHAAGVIHRDIKPANVILAARGGAKVLDFGIARPPPGPGPGLTEPGALLGTIPYMSPEQLRGAAVDARADVYALGCLLYEAAAGRPAFRGNDLATLIRHATTVDPPAPSSFVPTLPSVFDELVARAMAKDPARRFTHVGELAAALQAIAAGTTAPAVRAAPREAEAILVGRDAELSLLRGLLARAEAGGPGGLVVVSGEAGIGKSALAEALLRDASPAMLVARGRCIEQVGGGEAYQPFFEALEELLAGAHGDVVRDVLRAIAPAWSLRLRIATQSAERLSFERSSLGVTRDRMVRELIDALAALAARVPLLIVLEDLHWVDPSSVDVLRHLAHRLARHRAVVVATLRGAEVDTQGHPLRAALVEWRSKKSVPEVRLGELRRDDIAAWLDARFQPNDFSAALATAIHARTEGHTLFVSSMIDLLHGHGVVVRDGDRWRAGAVDTGTLGVPHSLRAMLRVKLDALAPEDRRALEAAAVQGPDFSSLIVADAIDADPIELDERLAAQARASQLIRACGEEELPDGSLATSWRFAHVLFRDALLEDLAVARRVALHRRVGEALLARHGAQAGRLAAVLGPHFEAGRDFVRAAEHLGRAGENAMLLCAAVEADAHLVRALACAARLPDAQRDARTVPLLRQRATVLTSMGRFADAERELDDALARARALGDEVLAGQMHVAQADVLLAWHRLDDAAPHLDAALATAARTGNDSLREEALVMRALERLIVGDIDASRAAFDGLLDQGPLALHLRGLLHYFRSEYAAAESCFARAADANERSLADGLLLMESRMFGALSQANQGRLGTARRGLEATLVLAERNGLKSMVARLENSIGWIYRELNLVEQALEHDRRAAAAGQASQESEAEANALLNLVEDQVARGDLVAAGEPFARVRQLADADAWLRWRYLLRLDAARARERLARGELTEAAAAVASLRARAGAQRAGKYQALAHELDARIAAARGDRAAALQAIAAARAALAATPVPVVAWRLEAFAARLGDAGAAARALGTAREIAADLEPVERDAFLSSAALRELEGIGTR